MKRYVDFQIAKGLAALGFKDLCSTFYDKQGVAHHGGGTDDWSQFNAYNRPTMDDAVNWLRSHRDLHIATHPTRRHHDNGYCWEFVIWHDMHIVFNSRHEYHHLRSHQQAQDLGVMRCIYLLQTELKK